MTQSRNRKVALVAVGTVACAAAGAAFAATKLHAAGPTTAPAFVAGKLIASTNGGHRFDGSRPRPGRGDEFTAAAAYLGTTQSTLLTQLQGGKTLAQIADATSGKSAAGLVDALVAAERTELDAAVTAGRITQAQEDAIVPSLQARFTDFVNNTRPDHRPGFGHRDHFTAAATYLGISESALATQLQGGKTLAQVADATPNKSAAGLIDALVAAEKSELDAAVTAGRITQAQEDAIVPILKARFTAFVNGTRPSGAPPFAPMHDRRI